MDVSDASDLWCCYSLLACDKSASSLESVGFGRESKCKVYNTVKLSTGAAGKKNKIIRMREGGVGTCCLNKVSVP